MGSSDTGGGVTRRDIAPPMAPLIDILLTSRLGQAPDAPLPSPQLGAAATAARPASVRHWPFPPCGPRVSRARRRADPVGLRKEPRQLSVDRHPAQSMAGQPSGNPDTRLDSRRQFRPQAFGLVGIPRRCVAGAPPSLQSTRGTPRLGFTPRLARRAPPSPRCDNLFCGGP